MNTKNLLVGIGLCLLSACTEVDNKLEVNRALEYCDRQVHRTLEVMHGKGREVDYTMMPRNIMAPPSAHAERRRASTRLDCDGASTKTAGTAA